MLFAHLKRILRLGRLRLRGPSGAKDEFLLAATAQNLRKLAKLIPFRRRSSPHEAERPHSAALTVVATTIPPVGRGGSSTKSVDSGLPLPAKTGYSPNLRERDRPTLCYLARKECAQEPSFGRTSILGLTLALVCRGRRAQ